MPMFSKTSLDKLATCHPDLQRLFKEVVKDFDCTILEGHRTKEKQNEAYAKGTSQLAWPNGNHNKLPSNAVDVSPYPYSTNREQITFFAGFVLGTAARLGLHIRWGGDWNQNHSLADNSFDDLYHFELGDGK